MHLAHCSGGVVFAIDNHMPFLKNLKQNLEVKNDNLKVCVLDMSMFSMGFKANSFDLIWAEGAVYFIGFEQGLAQWKHLLKPDGYAVFSELTWLKPDPPTKIKSYWKTEYPAMQSLDSNFESIDRQGYLKIDYFWIPENSWWENYYHPIEQKIAELRRKYPSRSKGSAQLDEAQLEVEMYREYCSWYGYAFYIMQNQPT
jgi:SAM-dependent methyltransferase